MKNVVNAILVDEKDNVVTAIEDTEPGDMVRWYSGSRLCSLVSSGAPAFHKIAVTDIPVGGGVVKYGEEIARSTLDIKSGQHVHIHNCTDPQKNTDDREV